MDFAILDPCLGLVLGLSDAPVGAPSVEEFSRAWRALRQGHAPEDFKEGGEGGRRQKGYEMLKCIHYSLKEADQRYFAQSQALVVSLHRDEKGRRIQVDFTACNRALQTASGVLGVCFNDGGAEGVNLSLHLLLANPAANPLSPTWTRLTYLFIGPPKST